MPFHYYLLRRLFLVIPTLFGISLIAFVIANEIPADAVTANLPQNALNNPEMVEAFREKWGLDQSPVEQYVTYLRNLSKGDMGVSIRSKRPVIDDIRQFLPATIELATTSILVGMLMGILFGVVSAVWRNSILDYVVRVFALIGVSFPVFVLALVGISLLYSRWGLVAGPGRLDFTLEAPEKVTGLFTIDSLLAGDWELFQNALSHLVLPSLILGSYTSGIIARITRASMLEVLNQDYIRTARSKGMREWRAVMRHALPNAMIPVITVIGLSYGNLLSGAVLTESIFAWPGFGRYMFRASTTHDFPAIMGGSMLIALIYVGVNFIVDILYYFLDPRIRTT